MKGRRVSGDYVLCPQLGDLSYDLYAYLYDACVVLMTSLHTASTCIWMFLTIALANTRVLTWGKRTSVKRSYACSVREVVRCAQDVRTVRPRVLGTNERVR